MIQQSFTYRSTEEFRAILHEMQASDSYKNAHCVLLQLMETNYLPSVLEERITAAKNTLPGIHLAGLTIGGSFSGNFSSGCTFFCFAESEVHIISYDVSAIALEEAAKDLREKLHAFSHVKALQLFIAGMQLDSAAFIDMISPQGDPLPIFGGAAGLPIFDVEKTDKIVGDKPVIEEGVKILDDANFIASPLAFSSRTYSTGIIAIIFCGENLHIKIDVNIGWRAIGKAMEITDTAGPLCAVTIDKEPASSAYQNYLNIKSDQYFMGNVSEFPLLLIDRPGMVQSRVPVMSSENGMLFFGTDIRKGEHVRFSYGNVRHILRGTRRCSNELYRFNPEAVFIYICANRKVFLKEATETEIDFFRRVNKECMYGFVWGEIMKNSIGGGVFNSALVSMGMREGGSERADAADINIEEKFTETVIPLSERLIAFLEATTEELKKSSDAKSNFLSNMSHEIRTPINAVLGLDEMILRESTEGNIQNYAQLIQNAGKTLLSLINDILDFSKIEAGRLDILPVAYDLSSTILDVTNMVLPRAKAKEIAFNVQVDKAMPHKLFGDEMRLKQCMLNLLTNAVKYTERGSVTFTVSAAKQDDARILLQVQVLDTGIGIKEEDLQQLFSPFERVDTKRNRSIEGTGLGLCIVKSMLSAMGSQLTVKSVYGSGSDFSFAVLQEVRDWEVMGDYLQTHIKANTEKAKYHESFQAPDAQILVVDDTAMNLAVIRGLLKTTRVKIDTAESARKALDMAKAKAYDILFIDHLMPQMDGVEMFHVLRADAHSASQKSPCIALKYLPKKLVLYPGQEGFVAEVQKQESETQNSTQASGTDALFSEFFGIDCPEALKNCGGSELFKEALKHFHGDISSKADKIEEYAVTGNIRDYTICVHALKSSARLIGATELSRMAAELERAGNEDRRDEIASKTPTLLDLYRSYGKKLAPLCGLPYQEEAAPKKAISEAKLADAISALKETVAVFDFDSADAIVKELDGYLLPEDFADTFKKIKEKLLAVDQQALLSLLD